MARLERPLLFAGLALVALHLLDLAFSGTDTSVPGVIAIVAVPAAWALAQPHVARPTRLVLGFVVGMLTFGFGVVSHGLHVVNSGPDWPDVTGVGMIAGGLLLAAAGLTAIAAPRRAPRRAGLGWRLAHGAGWLAAVPVFALLAVMPFAMALMVTHAPRWAIQESSLGIAHQEVAIESADGRAVGLVRPVAQPNGRAPQPRLGRQPRARRRAHPHARPPRLRRARARQPRQRRERGPLQRARLQRPAGRRRRHPAGSTRRPDVDPRRIAGFGVSLGAEVLLEAAARDPRLRAVVADGPTRPMDGRRVGDPALPERAFGALWLQAVRGISGMREAPSLAGIMPRIAPRPVLLIAGGVGAPDEIPANRSYRDAGGPTTQLWELADTGHTAGLRTHPADYERRTTTFLDRALGLKETP